MSPNAACGTPQQIAIADHELRWRYLTEDGEWVLVREPAPPTGEPSWYFVHRGSAASAD